MDLGHAVSGFRQTPGSGGVVVAVGLPRRMSGSAATPRNGPQLTAAMPGSRSSSLRPSRSRSDTRFSTRSAIV
jgi:hypothetical protein